MITFHLPQSELEINAAYLLRKKFSADSLKILRVVLILDLPTRLVSPLIWILCRGAVAQSVERSSKVPVWCTSTTNLERDMASHL